MSASAASFLLASVFCSSLAHVCLKLGADRIDGEGVTNRWLFAGVLLHIAALVVWVLGLRRSDLSAAYPFLMVGLVVVGTLSWAFLGERLGADRLAGYVLILLGVLIISRSHA